MEPRLHAIVENCWYTSSRVLCPGRIQTRLKNFLIELKRDLISNRVCIHSFLSVRTRLYSEKRLHQNLLNESKRFQFRKRVDANIVVLEAQLKIQNYSDAFEIFFHQTGEYVILIGVEK